MTKINSTRLGTSDVPGDICHNAFALFPKVGTLRAGVSFGDKTNTLLKKKPRLANYRLGVSSSVSLLAGICGPGYGIRFDAEGQTNGDTVTLKVKNDSTAAGFFAGYKITFSLTCKLEDWYPIRGWKPVIDLKPKFSIDVLNLLVELIKELVGADGDVDGSVEVEEEKDDKKDDKKKPRKIKSIALYDLQVDKIGSDGSVTVTPSYSIPINIAEMIPELRAFIKAMKKLWGSFGFGPSISLMIPVKVSVMGVQLDGTRYGNVSFADGTFTAKADGQASGGTGGTPKQLGVMLGHQPGFDLGLSFFAELSVAKFFKLGASTPTFPMLSMLGIDTQKKTPDPNEVMNTIGKQTIASLGCMPEQQEGWVEVILDPELTHG